MTEGDIVDIFIVFITILLSVIFKLSECNIINNLIVLQIFEIIILYFSENNGWLI